MNGLIQHVHVWLWKSGEGFFRSPTRCASMANLTTSTLEPIAAIRHYGVLVRITHGYLLQRLILSPHPRMPLLDHIRDI
jgi:hypothetical protein